MPTPDKLKDDNFIIRALTNPEEAVLPPPLATNEAINAWLKEKVYAGAEVVTTPSDETDLTNAFVKDQFYNQFELLIQSLKKWADDHNCAPPKMSNGSEPTRNAFEEFLHNVWQDYSRADRDRTGAASETGLAYWLNYNNNIKQALETILYELEHNPQNTEANINCVNELMVQIIVCGPGVSNAIYDSLNVLQGKNLSHHLGIYMLACMKDAFEMTLFEQAKEIGLVAAYINQFGEDGLLSLTTYIKSISGNTHDDKWVKNLFKNHKYEFFGLLIFNIPVHIAEDPDPLYDPAKYLGDFFCFNANGDKVEFDEAQVSSKIFNKYLSTLNINVFMDNCLEQIQFYMANNPYSIEQYEKSSAAISLFQTYGLAKNQELYRDIFVDDPITEALRALKVAVFVDAFDKDIELKAVITRDPKSFATASQEQPLLFLVQNEKIICHFFVNGFAYEIYTDNPELQQLIVDYEDASNQNRLTTLAKIFDCLIDVAPKPNLNKAMAKYHILEAMLAANLVSNSDMSRQDKGKIPKQNLKLGAKEVTISIVQLDDQLYIYRHYTKDGSVAISCLNADSANSEDIIFLSKVLKHFDEELSFKALLTLIESSKQELLHSAEFNGLLQAILAKLDLDHRKIILQKLFTKNHLTILQELIRQDINILISTQFVSEYLNKPEYYVKLGDLLYFSDDLLRSNDYIKVLENISALSQEGYDNGQSSFSVESLARALEYGVRTGDHTVAERMFSVVNEEGDAQDANKLFTLDAMLQISLYVNSPKLMIAIFQKYSEQLLMALSNTQLSIDLYSDSPLSLDEHKTIYIETLIKLYAAMIANKEYFNSAKLFASLRNMLTKICMKRADNSNEVQIVQEAMVKLWSIAKEADDEFNGLDIFKNILNMISQSDYSKQIITTVTKNLESLFKQLLLTDSDELRQYIISILNSSSTTDSEKQSEQLRETIILMIPLLIEVLNSNDHLWFKELIINIPWKEITNQNNRYIISAIIKVTFADKNEPVYFPELISLLESSNISERLLREVIDALVKSSSHEQQSYLINSKFIAILQIAHDRLDPKQVIDIYSEILALSRMKGLNSKDNSKIVEMKLAYFINLAKKPDFLGKFKDIDFMEYSQADGQFYEAIFNNLSDISQQQEFVNNELEKLFEFYDQSKVRDVDAFTKKIVWFKNKVDRLKLNVSVKNQYLIYLASGMLLNRYAVGINPANAEELKATYVLLSTQEIDEILNLRINSLLEAMLSKKTNDQLIPHINGLLYHVFQGDSDKIVKNFKLLLDKLDWVAVDYTNDMLRNFFIYMKTLQEDKIEAIADMLDKAKIPTVALLDILTDNEIDLKIKVAILKVSLDKLESYKVMFIIERLMEHTLSDHELRPIVINIKQDFDKRFNLTKFENEMNELTNQSDDDFKAAVNMLVKYFHDQEHIGYYLCLLKASYACGFQSYISDLFSKLMKNDSWNLLLNILQKLINQPDMLGGDAKEVYVKMIESLIGVLKDNPIIISDLRVQEMFVLLLNNDKISSINLIGILQICKKQGKPLPLRIKRSEGFKRLVDNTTLLKEASRLINEFSDKQNVQQLEQEELNSKDYADFKAYFEQAPFLLIPDMIDKKLCLLIGQLILDLAPDKPSLFWNLISESKSITADMWTSFNQEIVNKFAAIDYEMSDELLFGKKINQLQSFFDIMIYPVHAYSVISMVMLDERINDKYKNFLFNLFIEINTSSLFDARELCKEFVARTVKSNSADISTPCLKILQAFPYQTMYLLELFSDAYKDHPDKFKTIIIKLVEQINESNNSELANQVLDFFAKVNHAEKPTEEKAHGPRPR